MAFYIEVYAYAIIVHTRADQLLPQLLMVLLTKNDRNLVYAYPIIVHTRADQLLPQLLMVLLTKNDRNLLLQKYAPSSIFRFH